MASGGIGVSGRRGGGLRWMAAVMRGLSAAAVAIAAMGGCGSIGYVTPGGPADLAAFTDPDIAELMRREPAARFPATIAVVRVQEPGYRCNGVYAYGQGNYSAVLGGDIESERPWERLSGMEQVRGVAPVNRLVLPRRLDTERDVRLAAARLRADMVLIYTLDTDFFVEDTVEPLTVLTLGIAPNRTVHLTTAASALLVDTQSGFVYGAAEATAAHRQLTSGWTTSETVDQSRRKTEREALAGLLERVERLWPGIVAEHQAAARAASLGGRAYATP